MSKPGVSLGALPDNFCMEREHWRRIGRPPQQERVTITADDLDVFEALSSGLFNESFGPCR
jgi:hypothetical protein